MHYANEKACPEDLNVSAMAALSLSTTFTGEKGKYQLADKEVSKKMREKAEVRKSAVNENSAYDLSKERQIHREVESVLSDILSIVCADGK